MERKLQFEMGPATRDAFGKALAELGHEDPDLVVVDADVSNSTRTEYFAKEFPDRFFQVGIAESNLVGIASGLAACGKHTWIASFACFMMCNAFDQLRMSVAFPGLPVKVAGSHSGISIGEDGPSQMGIEDVALAAALPGFAVLVPADGPAARAATRALHAWNGPAYLRLGRPKLPIVYSDDSLRREFAVGKAIRLRDGDDVTLVANGMLVATALQVAEALAGRGVNARVLDCHTVKPIDEESLERAARETGALVVCEEHISSGGLGAAVAYAVGRRHPVPIEYVNLGDSYAESGSAEALFEKYGLAADHMTAAAGKVLERKSKG
ncbi:MAG: transketolase [Gemmatimonas sp. SM23_52]|nr:MAG: transketolase [Gemmatimonas sp. SM23_52]